MPTIDLDFGNLIPEEGEYDVKVREVNMKTAKSSGGKYLEFIYEILGPTCDGVQLRDNRSLELQSRIFLKQCLEGLTGTDWDQDNMTLDPDDLVGLEARAVVYLEDYQGSPQPRVKRVYQAPLGTPYPQQVLGSVPDGNHSLFE